MEHPPVRPALAFRFETDAGSVVFSGDTAECEAMALLAEGADVLVHEAVNLDFYADKGFAPEFLATSRSHTPRRREPAGWLPPPAWGALSFHTWPGVRSRSGGAAVPPQP